MDLKIKVYADGADITTMISEYQKGIVKGFTTNPTLMKKAGVTNYVAFVKDVIKSIPDLPISFEVFGDDFDEMEKEALKLSEFGEQIYVKIPITNTKGESSIPLIKKLSKKGVNLNITAIMTIEQVQDVVDAVENSSKTIVSVFAGRIADTGVDPLPLMRQAKDLIEKKKNIELLWASSRELINIFQAEEVGCDIITCTAPILAKIPMIGKDLKELSLDTVKMFSNDIKALGFSILE